jgi:integrase
LRARVRPRSGTPSNYWISAGAAREGRLGLTKSNTTRFDEYARSFLSTVQHPNTQKRYGSSVRNLVTCLRNIKLSDITSDVIEEFKEKRLSNGIRTATVNRDLAVLRRIMRLAKRKKFINDSPFRDVEFLEERKQRRRPHIVSFEEEERILNVADPHIRALAVLILETGMRSNREALSLPWSDVDLVNDLIQVRESKTKAGERTIPISDRCKSELLRWRSLFGPEFSPYVFPNMRKPSTPLKDIRRSWAKAVKDAGLHYFWIYDLRHTLSSRLTQAGVSPLFVAQLIGHSGTSILSTYVRAVDEYRRDAIHKLEHLRATHASAQERIKSTHPAPSTSLRLLQLHYSWEFAGVTRNASSIFTVPTTHCGQSSSLLLKYGLAHAEGCVSG